jgi:hypothetical protein
VGLTRDLGPGNVGLDTAIFIYFIEENPQFLPAILPLFRGRPGKTRAGNVGTDAAPVSGLRVVELTAYVK